MDFWEEGCRSCKLWSETISSLKLAILIADLEGGILYANEKAGKILGFPVHELRALPISQFITPQDLSNFYPNLLYLAQGARSFEGEIMLVRRDTCRFIAHLSMQPMLHPRSGDKLMFLCFQDIQSQKEIEHSIARDYYPDLVRIADGIAHEIRNPLVGIGGFAQRLYRVCSDTPDNRRYFDHLMRNVKKIDNLIKKVEFFAKLPQPVMAKTSLKDAVEEAVADSGPKIEEKKASVLQDLQNIRVCMDHELIGRAVCIFIENALDAVQEGGSLEIRTEHVKDEAIIRVSDNGKGIAPTDLPYIFNPFFSTKPDGAGIGLAIVRRIAEGHGGSVEVNSTPRQGATFYLKLPMERRRAIRARPLA